ncbi:MAG: potassium-transporting ATPase subunit A [Planctomycetes bacterium]|nr:potassium-transporting ATPase subunit A [Planctomycetota bacterium]
MLANSPFAGSSLAVLVLVGCALLSWPLGRWLRAAMDPQTASGPLARCDAWFRRLGGGATAGEHGWRRYCVQLLVFNVVMFTVGVLLLALQPGLPLNPDGKGALEWSLVFHTGASFTTNTNLQHYSGEVAMSHGSQLWALMWQQFVSAATGLAALTALARGLAGRPLGNFFVDVQRATFLVLLPLSLLVACLLVLGGMPMTLDGAVQATTLEGAVQTIARGPVAAFVAIKQLGTNGGGFFGPNSTHPFENPSFATNVVTTMALIVLPMACVWLFGRIVGNRRHAVVLFAAMSVLLLAKLGVAMACESAPTPAFAGLPVAGDVGNLEGKELRFGPGAAPLWAVLTTCTSNGSVNCMHDSLNPLTGLVPMVGMWLNETFGGVGVGMINLFVYLVLAVFVAGMMVGRTPEYLSRRVEVHEVKLAVLAMFAHALCILGGTALFAATSWGIGTPNDPGAHGFSEILYEFTSAAANNGSGFEGLGDNTVPWNVATGLVMLLARFVPIVLPLAIAGALAGKRTTAASAGTLAVDTPTFGVMVLATIVFLGALTFLPAAALGPIAEHLQTVR